MGGKQWRNSFTVWSLRKQQEEDRGGGKGWGFPDRTIRYKREESVLRNGGFFCAASSQATGEAEISVAKLPLTYVHFRTIGCTTSYGPRNSKLIMPIPALSRFP